MIFEYLPNIGVKLDSHTFEWGADRASIRPLLDNQHEEDNHVVEMSEFFDGDKSHDIEVRKDIYENYKDGENYFFLIYDEKDQLHEVEFHWGMKVLVEGVTLDFEKDINQQIKQLSKLDRIRRIEEGSVYFKRLKLSVSNAASMGGDGNDLAYVYVSQNIEHLLE